jgi:hypothetical protein
MKTDTRNKPTDRQTDRQTDRETFDKQTEGQTDRPTDRQTEGQTDRQTSWQTKRWSYTNEFLSNTSTPTLFIKFYAVFDPTDTDK